MNKQELLGFIRWCKINKYDPLLEETADRYIRIKMMFNQDSGFGEHYIVLNKKVYKLDNEKYSQLIRLDAEKVQAISMCDSFSLDPMEAKGEVDNLNNYLDWIAFNLTPVSLDSDNFDLHRYDKTTNCDAGGKDLPF